MNRVSSLKLIMDQKIFWQCFGPFGLFLIRVKWGVTHYQGSNFQNSLISMRLINVKLFIYSQRLVCHVFCYMGDEIEIYGQFGHFRKKIKFVFSNKTNYEISNCVPLSIHIPENNIHFWLYTILKQLEPVVSFWET